MARNEEKSQSMLSRYLQTKKGDGPSNRRPYLSTLCDDVDEAGRWRQQIIGDIRRRVSEIQNPGLDDIRVRELNDSINKLLREKKHWERRIVFLGGQDYAKRGPHNKGTGDDVDVSVGVFQHNGYFYFGAARQLPGVQELIDRQQGFKKFSRSNSENEESSAALYKKVDIEYFGYLDDHDGSLRCSEQLGRNERRDQMSREWKARGEKGTEAEWDEKYLDFVGRKPDVNPDADLQAVILERRKLQALEQLQSGLQKLS